MCNSFEKTKRIIVWMENHLLTSMCVSVARPRTPGSKFISIFPWCAVIEALKYFSKVAGAVKTA